MIDKMLVEIQLALLLMKKSLIDVFIETLLTLVSSSFVLMDDVLIDMLVLLLLVLLLISKELGTILT